MPRGRPRPSNAGSRVEAKAAVRGAPASRASGHAGPGVPGTEPQPFLVDGAPDGQLDGLATSRDRSFQAIAVVGATPAGARANRPFRNSEIGSSRRPSSHGSISRTRWLRCASADGEPPALEHDGGCGEAVAEFQRRERAYVDRTASGALANSRACSVPVTAKIRCIWWQPRTSTRRQSASLRRARAIKIACRPLESMNVSSLRSRITAALPRAASDRASASCGAVAMSSSPLGVTRVTPGPSANHVQANPEAGSDHRESSDG
jgi:hypothetical protein